MVKFEVLGHKVLELHHLVLDYNGTLAIDGIIIPEVKKILDILSERIQIHILTADTFGTVGKNLNGIKCQLTVIGTENQQMQKAQYVKKLGKNSVVSIGNGLNDALMLKASALGIIVIQKEGAAIQSLQNADIVCSNVLDALELLLNPGRIIATLRK